MATNVFPPASGSGGVSFLNHIVSATSSIAAANGLYRAERFPVEGFTPPLSINGTTVSTTEFIEIKNSQINYVVNPVSWQAQPTSNFNNRRILASAFSANNNLFFAGGEGTDPHLYISTNGINWTSANISFSGSSINAIVANAGTVVIVGGGNKLVFTRDGGTSFNPRSPGFSTQSVTSLTFGNGRWVASDEFGRVSRSTTDAESWTMSGEVTNTRTTFLHFANSLYAAGSSNGQFRTSTDSFTWTSRTGAASTWISGIAFGNNLWAVSSFAGLRTSTDTITWTERSTGLLGSPLSVSFLNNTFIATSDSASTNLATSSDGITWTTRNVGYSNGVDNVSFGLGLFVSFGYVGNSSISPNVSGINEAGVSLEYRGPLESIN